MRLIMASQAAQTATLILLLRVYAGRRLMNNYEMKRLY
jgi:hypothetical protein